MGSTDEHPIPCQDQTQCAECPCLMAQSAPHASKGRSNGLPHNLLQVLSFRADPAIAYLAPRKGHSRVSLPAGRTLPRMCMQPMRLKLHHVSVLLLCTSNKVWGSLVSLIFKELKQTRRAHSLYVYKERSEGGAVKASIGGSCMATLPQRSSVNCCLIEKRVEGDFFNYGQAQSLFTQCPQSPEHSVGDYLQSPSNPGTQPNAKVSIFVFFESDVDRRGRHNHSIVDEF